MRVIKKVGVLIVSIILFVVFLIPRIVIMIINIVDSLLYIVKSTLTFLIEQIKAEVLNTIQDGKSNEKQQKGEKEAP